MRRLFEGLIHLSHFIDVQLCMLYRHLVVNFHLDVSLSNLNLPYIIHLVYDLSFCQVLI